MSPRAQVDVLSEGLGPSLSEISTSVLLRAIRTHLGMDVAFVSEFTDGRRVFRYVDSASEASPVQVGRSDPLERSYCQRVVDGRLPELIRDAKLSAEAARLEATQSLPIGAHLSVPIRTTEGHVYGTLCCFSSEADHTLNERDLAMMRVFADLISQQVETDQATERRRRAIVARLRAVVADGGLSIAYQPIIDLLRARPAGYEALARFPGGATRGPDAWFREAAEVGKGVELELAAIRAGLTGLSQLPAETYLAVNVSAATLICGELSGVLANTAVERLVLEITEHEVIPVYEQLCAELAPLRRRGVRVAVDDAGAGYSSFRHILRLRPDFIKLDMAITRDIDRDPARRALASALIAFAGDTDSLLVAEGVQTDGELRTLRGLGVTAAQGYRLGLPVPIEAVAKFDQVDQWCTL